MKKLIIFDKPMCSAKLSCGQANSKEFTKVESLKDELLEYDIDVEVFYANFHMQEFLKNEEVNEAMSSGGLENLPIAVVNGKVIKKGQYPTAIEVRDAFKPSFIKIPMEFMRNSCGCGGNCDGSCK